eukprot:1484047-Rhodomonas_salina.1
MDAWRAEADRARRHKTVAEKGDREADINQPRALLEQQRAQHPPMGTEDEKVTPWKVGRVYTVIPGRLSFSVHLNNEMTVDKIKAHPYLFFFSSDCQDKYYPFNQDFGPVNLGVVHRFCQDMRDKLNCPQLKSRHLVYYSFVDA